MARCIAGRLRTGVGDVRSLPAWIDAAMVRGCALETTYVGAGAYAPRDTPYPAGVIQINASYPTLILCRILVHELCHHELYWHWPDLLKEAGLPPDTGVFAGAGRDRVREAICTCCEDELLPLPEGAGWDGLPERTNRVVVRTPKLLPKINSTLGVRRR